MPKLDGAQATSIIRQFDHLTPIISMTVNSAPNDIMYYYSQGMNDVLPKPFTKQSLLAMIDKHLMHLKAFTMVHTVARGPGIPPMSDEKLERALAVSSQQQPLLFSGAPHDDATFDFSNPLASMGVSDDFYTMFLQSIEGNHILEAIPEEAQPFVDAAKRSIEEVEVEMVPGTKKPRFELIE